MTARIYKPAKTAMQSGSANTKAWVLDFELEEPRRVEPLMGWTSSGDMRQQLRLRFDTQAEAVAYCERTALPIRRSRPSRNAAGSCLIRIILPSSVATPGRTKFRLAKRYLPAGARVRPLAPARWRSSEMKRSSGIGWPSRNPWPKSQPMLTSAIASAAFSIPMATATRP